MLQHLAIFLCVSIAIASATDVKRCPDNKPFPLEVRVHGCDVPPCDMIKGKNVVFEIDFVSYKYITSMNALVKATALGFTVPFELPEDVRTVCKNLMYGAYCPLYPTEDVTYLFVFLIGNYPEVSAKIEISIVDQDEDITTCFLCDIKVKKGESTVYQIDF